MPTYKGTIKRWNKWYYRINHKGNRIERGGFITAEEASKTRSEHLRKLQLTDTSPSNMTLTDFIIQYLEEYEKINNRLTTLIKTESVCRNHIIPLIGDLRLQSIKTFHLTRFQNEIVHTRSPSVAHNTMRILRKILNKAVEWELMAYNPLRGKIPPAPKSEHPILSPEQLFNLVDSLEGRDKCVAALAGFSGFRRSEIFGLRWEDIDFKNNTIHLRRQYCNDELVPLKTQESEARIPIWDRLKNILMEWKLQSGSPEWVFKGKGNKPYSPESWVSKNWTRIRTEYNFPGELRFHDLRHTFASIMLSKGAPPADVQKLMRHTSIQTTINIYRHLLPGQLEKNFEIFDSLYGEGRGEG